jgi:hypothetical protein
MPNGCTQHEMHEDLNILTNLKTNLKIVYEVCQKPRWVHLGYNPFKTKYSHACVTLYKLIINYS